MTTLIQIPLKNTPSFITSDGTFNLYFYKVYDAMMFDVLFNNEAIYRNIICASNKLLIPFKKSIMTYNYMFTGNIIYPNYTDFGTNSILNKVIE